MARGLARECLPSGYNPLYFASAVLPSGNVIIMGGEYNAGVSAETTLGAMYYARTNRWTSVAAPPGWTSIGDAASVVLPNGKFMLANCCSRDEAIATVSASGVTWTSTGTGKADANSEEGWLLLPSGNVLTVDATNLDVKHSEIYNFSTGRWSSAGSTVVQLEDSSYHELGPMVLRPDGTVICRGSYNQQRDLYDRLPANGLRRRNLAARSMLPMVPLHCCRMGTYCLTPVRACSTTGQSFLSGTASRSMRCRVCRTVPSNPPLRATCSCCRPARFFSLMAALTWKFIRRQVVLARAALRTSHRSTATWHGSVEQCDSWHAI